jgi:hypothetical protein
VAAGLRIEFTVDPELTGLVIGKKVSPPYLSYPS